MTIWSQATQTDDKNSISVAARQRMTTSFLCQRFTYVLDLTVCNFLMKKLFPALGDVTCQTGDDVYTL
jgi:hypothetical protein